MKKHLLVLMILCFSMVLKSENYHPFPTENAIWHALGFDFSKENDPNSKMYSHKYFVNGDTIIENETWQKIYFTNNYLGGVDFKGEMNYVAALRENEQKQILAKFSHLPEFVLYDFSLEIGDTIWYEHAAESAVDGNYPFYFDDDDDFYSPHYKVVVDKDSVLLENGEYRNRLTLYSYVDHYGNIHIANHWVEGFGCTRWSGLFHPIVVIRCGKCVGYTFVCFMQDEEVIFLDNPYCDDCLCETFSADYHPFPTENAIWHALAFKPEWKTNKTEYEVFSQQFILQGDTVIENEDWKKIYYRNQYLGNIDFRDDLYYTAAIRENDNKQIIVKIAEYPEFVLYDFSLEVGDTIHYDLAAGSTISGSNPMIFSSNHPHYKVVIAKDSILLENDQYRNRIKLHSFSENYGALYDNNYWVEGMGSTEWTGLFHPIAIEVDDCGYWKEFVCFMQDEEVIYLDNPYCDDCLCETFTSIDNVVDTNPLLNVYPNPSKGNLTIAISESATGNLVLRITDISGKITFEQFLRNQRQINMNLGTYKSGFYIIQLWDVGRNKLMENRKIIIE